MRNYSFKFLVLACFLMIASYASAQFRIETRDQQGSEVTVDENGAKHWISHFNTTQAVSTATPNGDGTYTLDKKSFRNRNGYQANVYGRTVADDADSLISNGNRYNMPNYNQGANIMHFASLGALDTMLMGEVANGSTTILTTNPATGLFDVGEGDAAFGVSPGKYKKVEYGFHLSFAGYEVQSDVSFDILTYDEGVGLNGATAKYDLLVYVGGSDAGNLLASVSDFYETGSGKKSVNLAEATGLNISSFSNSEVYFFLQTTGSGTFIADDVRDPMIVIDNIAATLMPPIFTEPAVPENTIGNNKANPLTGTINEEGTFGFPIKTTGRLGQMKIEDNLYLNGQDFKTYKPLTFLATGAVMANDGNGNYTVPVDYTLTPATQDPGTLEWSKQSIVIAAPDNGPVNDDFMFYLNILPNSVVPKSSRLEIDMGTRIWYDLYFGSPKKVAYVTLDKEMDATASPVAEDPIVKMLQADENFMVDVLVVAADADLGDLSGYDVVIAQESFGSSSAIFKPGGSLGMGSIPVPFILNKAYTMRGGRGFADGTSGSGGENGNVKYLMVSADNQANDLFSGLTFVGDSVQVFRATADDAGAPGGTKALQFATDVTISAPITYDFRDQTIITNQQSEDGKLKLGGAYNYHSADYGLDMKAGNQIEISVSGNATVRFLGSEYSSLSMTAATVGSAGTITPAGPVPTVVVNDLQDYYTFEYTGDAETLRFTAVVDGDGQNSDVYLPLVEVIEAGHTDATLLGSGTMDPENATVCLNDIPAGSTIGSETLQARMIALAMNFGAISKDFGTNFTSEGLTIWRNAVYSLAGLDVPSTLVDAPDVATKKIAYVTLDKEMDATATPVDEDPIIKMLQEQQYIDVDVMVVAADSVLGDLSMYDAVIAQESFGSSSAIFKPGGSLGIGSIPVPFILNKAYTLRGGRGFADGTAGSGGENGNVTYLKVAAENQGNDLFKGITFDTDSFQVFRATADDAGAVGGTKALQFATDVEISADNTLLASGTMDPANATVCVNDIPAGDTIGSEVLQARMIAFAMNFGAISKNKGTNFTSEGLTLWRNAVLSLVGLDIPDEMVEAPAAAAILMHSYTFEEADTAIDVVGGANGTMTGGMVKDGKFTSAPGGYIELPAGDIAINTYPAVSFEMYIAESESAPTNSMAFYLGGSPGDLGANGTFVATNHWNGPATRAAISTGQDATPWTKETAVTTDPLSAPGMTHVVMTIDGDSLKLFINGEQVGSDALSAMDNSIAALSNDFAWIARGGYGGDPTWLGTISEFNIYEGTLTDAEIAEKAAMWPEDKVTPRSIAYVTLDKEMDATASTVDADPIITMLEADENINLTVMVVAADSVLGDLSMYDAVVVQESFGSSSAILKPGGSLGMGGIPVPFLLNKAYTLRGGRGFADGTAGSGGENGNVTYLEVMADNQDNDLFKGISFDADSFMVFRETADDAGAPGGTKALQFATDVEISADNTLLASGTMDPENATVCINDIPAGDTIGSEVLQARMIAFAMNFGAISKNMGTNFTDEGLTVWRNAIYSLAGIPVPDTLVSAPDPHITVKNIAYIQNAGFTTAAGASTIDNDPVVRMLNADEHFAVTVIQTDAAGSDVDLSGYDLAIAQETFGSSSAIYQPGGPLGIEDLTIPVIYNKTWALRDGKAITDGGAASIKLANTVSVTVDPANQSNPIYSGITFTDDMIRLYNEQADNSGSEGTNAIDVLNGLVGLDGTLLATVDSVVDPGSAIVINDIPAGSVLGTEDTLGVRMIAFAFNYGPIIRGDGNNITSEALTIWRNAAYILTGMTPPAELFVNEDYWPVAVQDVEMADGVMVYPNPARDFARVAFTMNSSAQVQLHVYNTLGQKVQSSTTMNLNAGENMLEINTSNLNNGMYIYQLEVGATTYNGKFYISK